VPDYPCVQNLAFLVQSDFNVTASLAPKTFCKALVLVNNILNSKTPPKQNAAAAPGLLA
jgi:hypothetical protein